MQTVRRPVRRALGDLRELAVEPLERVRRLVVEVLRLEQDPQHLVFVDLLAAQLLVGGVGDDEQRQEEVDRQERLVGLLGDVARMLQHGAEVGGVVDRLVGVRKENGHRRLHLRDPPREVQSSSQFRAFSAIFDRFRPFRAPRTLPPASGASSARLISETQR